MNRNLHGRHSVGNISQSSSSSSVSTVRRHRPNFGDVRISSHSVIYVVGNDSSDKCLNSESSFPKLTKGLVCFRTNVNLCDKYEAQEAVIFLGKEDGTDLSGRRSYENIDNADENSFCDDFDDSLSDSSDQCAPNPHVKQVEVQVVERGPAEEPARSEGIYGFMKQAGQRMRKHWTLKSLSRMRKNKSSPNLNNALNLGHRTGSFKSSDKPPTAQSTFYLNTSGTLPRQISVPPPPPPPNEQRGDPRRLSISPISRPTAPPPPPPPRNSLDHGIKSKSIYNGSTTSSGDNEGYAEGQRRLSRSGNSQWYVETSTDSASEHGSSVGSELNLKFADEPLYQFYNAEVVEMALSELTDSDGYEEVNPVQPSALDLVSHQHRSLWSELPQVRQSGLLDSLSQGRKRLQEAKFEVLTSEASYFKSLSVLDKVFASCPLFCDDNILSRNDRKVLFGSVHSVRKCSEQLLSGLQKCWQGDMLLQGLCQVVHDHVKSHRQVYIDYCSSQINMDRTLKSIKQTNSNFSTVLMSLESASECQSLTLYSFLMLPMQRITRLRLLLETIHALLDSSDDEFLSCQQALEILNKCVTECNEGARRQERREEMDKLSKQIEFPPEMHVPPLADSSRWLVRSGQVSQLNMDAKLTLGRRLTRSLYSKLTLFLFTDLLLVTKKKSEDSFWVVDHCQRNLVEVQELPELPSHTRHLLSFTLLENCEAKTHDMTVSCESEMERQRWLQVLSAPQSEEPGETLYEGWDCPRVCAVHTYLAAQPDELSLAPGDTVNVLRKTDGWFFGERSGDCEKGWFPGSFTREIASEHVRARNLKQRNALLKLSANLVQQQRKVKS